METFLEEASPSRVTDNGAPLSPTAVDDHLATSLTENKNLGTVQESLFGLLYAMCERGVGSQSSSSVKKFMQIFSLTCVDFIQLLTLPSLSSWSNTPFATVAPIIQFSENATHSSFGAYTALFWLSSGCILGAASLCGVVLHTIRAHKLAVFPLRLLRAFVRVFVTVFYISVLKVFLAAFVRSDLASGAIPQLAYWGTSGLMLLFLVPFSLVVSLVYHDKRAPLAQGAGKPVGKKRNTTGILSEPHGRLDLLYTLVRTVLTVASVFNASSSPVLIDALLFILLIGVSGTYVLLLPYYRFQLNALRAALLCSAAFFALFTGVMESVAQGEVKSILAGVFIVLTPLCGLLAVLAAKFRLKMIRIVEARYLVESCEEDEAALAEAGLTVRLSGILIDMDVELAARTATLKDDSPTLAEKVYEFGLLKFPNSAYVRLCYSTFLLRVRQDLPKAMAVRAKVWECDPYLDDRFWLYSSMRDLEQSSQQTDLGASSMNYVKMVEFRARYKEASKYHDQALKLLRSFWAGFSKKNIAGALSTLTQKLEHIHVARERARKTYGDLLKKFPKSKTLLRQYGRFMQDVEVDSDSANVYYARADEIEEAEARKANMKDGSQISGSESTTISERLSVASSKVSAVVNAARKSDNLKASKADDRAVRLLHIGVIFGMGIITAFSAVVYWVVTSLFTDFGKSMGSTVGFADNLNILMETTYWIRSYELSILPDSPHLGEYNISFARAQALSYVELLRQNFLTLYLTFYGSFSAYKSPQITALWQDTFYVSDWVPIGDGSDGHYVERLTTLWDEGLLFLTRARQILVQPQASFNRSASNPDFRYLVFNSQRTMRTRLERISQVCVDTLLDSLDKGIMTVAILCSLLVAMLVLQELLIFRPSFRKVQKHSNGAADIIMRLPKQVLKERARFYRNTSVLGTSKASELTDVAPDSASESDQDAADPSALSARKGKRTSFIGDGAHRQHSSPHHHHHRRRGSRSGSHTVPPASEHQPISPTKQGALLLEALDSDSSWPEQAPLPLLSLTEPVRPANLSGPNLAAHNQLITKIAPTGPVGLPLPLATSMPPTRARPGLWAGQPGQKHLFNEVVLSHGSGSESDHTSPSSETMTPPRTTPTPTTASAPSSQHPSPERPKPPGSPKPHSLGGSERPPRARPKPPMHSGSGHNTSLEPLAEDESYGSQSTEGSRTSDEGEEGEEDMNGRGWRKKGSALQVKTSMESLKPILKGKRASLASVSSVGGLPTSADTETAETPTSEMHKSPEVEGMGMSHLEHKGDGRGLPPVLPSVANVLPVKEGLMSRALRTFRKGPRRLFGGSSEIHGPHGCLNTTALPPSSLPSIAGAAVSSDAKTDSRDSTMLSGLRKRYLAAFVLIALVAAANFVTCYELLQQSRPFSPQIMLAGKRRAYLSRFWVRELYVKDSLAGDKADVKDLLRVQQENFQMLHHSLKVGNSSLNLPAGDDTDVSLDLVNYAHECEQDTIGGRYINVPCVPDLTAVEDLYKFGMDSMIHMWGDIMDDVQQFFDCDGGVCQPSGAYGPYDSPNLLQLTGIYYPVDLLLARSIQLFHDNATTSISVATAVEASILAFMCVFLFALYLALFRPMIRKLREESNRVAQLLSMLPRSIVMQIKFLHKMFVTQPDDLAG